MAMVFGGSIRFSTAAFRSGEYPTSLSYPAHLRNRGKVERRTTTLTQGGHVATASGTDRIRPARLRGLVAGAGLGARWARRRWDVAGGGSDGGDAEGETLGNQVTTSQWADCRHSLRLHGLSGGSLKAAVH